MFVSLVVLATKLLDLPAVEKTYTTTDALNALWTQIPAQLVLKIFKSTTMDTVVVIL